MSPGNIRDSVSVRGSPVVDVSSTAVTTHFDDDKLAALPGSRDIFSVLANTPGVAQLKMDVGGNGALALQDYTAYGLRSVLGVHRNEVEGIRVGGANGSSDNYLSDYASFAEIAVTAVGNSAAMPVPGILVRYVSKSGGNAFHGNVYADFQDDGMAATNIDNDQIRRGVTGGPGLPARDVNRLQRFRDFTIDVRRLPEKGQGVVVRRLPILERGAEIPVAARYGGHARRRGRHRQSHIPPVSPASARRLPAARGVSAVEFFAVGASLPLQTSDALPSLDFPVSVWKGEYNAAVTDALYVEARVGGYHSDGVGYVQERGAARGGRRREHGQWRRGRVGAAHQPPTSQRLLELSEVWLGRESHIHHRRRVHERPGRHHRSGYLNPCNCVSTLNNSVPTQVQIQVGTNVSKNDLTTAAGFVDDTWRVTPRDAVAGPPPRSLSTDSARAAGTGRGDSLPRSIRSSPSTTGRRALGMTADLTGDGKTVVKLHYGKFWVYPSPMFTTAFNPNPPGWSRTYAWLNDVDGNGRWSPGEEGALSSVAGGSTSTRLDPEIDNTFAHQASAYIEREVAPDFGVRTGLVLIARRQPYGTINVSRPLDAYSMPVSVVDPGPDGRLGSVDDGGNADGLRPDC